jgi:hypothetical protein
LLFSSITRLTGGFSTVNIILSIDVSGSSTSKNSLGKVIPAPWTIFMLEFPSLNVGA